MLPKGLDRRVWNLAIARAVNTAGLSLVMAFLGVYVVETRGYAAVVYGGIAVVANLAQSASNAWAGALSDRIGRRPLITWSLLVRAGVIATLGTQVLLDAPLWSLTLSIVASSALRGCFEPVAYALVADVVEPARRIDAFGVQRMGTNLGWALGPAVGGMLSLAIPYGAIFFVAAAGLAAAAYITRSVVDPISAARHASQQAARKASEHAAHKASEQAVEQAARDASDPQDAVPLAVVSGATSSASDLAGAAPPAVETESSAEACAARAAAPPRLPLRQRIAVAFADRELRLLIAGTFLSAMLTTQMYSTFAIYMTDYVGVTKAEVGLLYTLNGGMVLALQMPAMTLIRSRGIRAILPWASLLSTVGFALIALASLPGAALAIFVITCAEMLFAPAHQATIAELAAPGARGRMFGVVGFAQLLGIALAPLTGGLLLDAIGQHSVALWLSLATLGLGQTFCLWRFARCPRTTGVTGP